MNRSCWLPTPGERGHWSYESQLSYEKHSGGVLWLPNEHLTCTFMLLPGADCTIAMYGAQDAKRKKRRKKESGPVHNVPDKTGHIGYNHKFIVVNHYQEPTCKSRLLLAAVKCIWGNPHHHLQKEMCICGMQNKCEKQQEKHMLWLPLDRETTGTMCFYPWLSYFVFIFVCLQWVAGCWIENIEIKRNTLQLEIFSGRRWRRLLTPTGGGVREWNSCICRCRVWDFAFITHSNRKPN